jgi:copper chaperone NosL
MSHRVPLAGRLAWQLALVAALGCAGGSGPRPIVLGEDSCAFCRMAITDARYGGELRTSTGRVHTFDAVECLAGFVAAAGDSARFDGVWVSDFEGGPMLDAQAAVYLQGGSLHSPMGRQLTAFAPTRDTRELVERFGGTVLRWHDVVAQAATMPHGSTLNIVDSAAGSHLH